MSAPVPPPTVPLCPECGVQQDEARKGARKHIRAGFWFPVVCTLVAAALIGLATTQNITARQFVRSSRSGIAFTPEITTLGDLRSGKNAHQTAIVRLVESFADYQHFGSGKTLAVAFPGPEGFHIDVLSIGRVLGWGRAGACDDVRTPAAPGTSSPREFHIDAQRVSYDSSGMGWGRHASVSVPGLGMLAGIVIGVAYLPRILGWLPFTSRVSLGPATASLYRWAHRACIAAIVGWYCLPTRSTVAFSSQQWATSEPLLFVTGIDIGGTDEPHSLTTEEQIIQEVLAVTPPGMPDDTLLGLCVTFDRGSAECSGTDIGVPWRWVSVERQTWAEPSPSSDASWSWRYGSLVFVPAIQSRAFTQLPIEVFVPGVVTTLVSLWLVYQVSSLPLWLWRGRRIRRRTARGECLACGYDLKVPASPTSIST